MGDSFREKAQEYIQMGGIVRLSILLLNEEKELNSISQTMGDQAFLGGHVKREALGALREEHQRLMNTYVLQIETIAQELGVECNQIKGTGEFVDCVLHHVHKQAFDIIFLARDDRPFILRFLFGSQVDRAVQLITKEGKKPILVQGDS